MAENMPKLDRNELLAEFDRTVSEVADAIDDAPAGRISRDSEEKARDSLDRFRQVVYKKAIQGKIDAAEATFSPSGQCGDRTDETA